jgi:hypothetical protein
MNKLLALKSHAQLSLSGRPFYLTTIRETLDKD